MPFVAQVCSELPTGCRTPTPPMLESGFPYAESADSQEDGTRTPRDTGVFPIDHLQDKLRTLQAATVKPWKNDFKVAEPLYVLPQAEECAAKVKAQLAQLSPLAAGPLPLGRLEGKEEEAILPPPAPHAVPRPAPAATERVITVGSVGHPFTCAEACKYVKRKGGCREGASCTKCHECFWSRIPAGADAIEQKIQEPVQQEAQPFSVGSAGHPYTCSNPCKYVWRKQGCRDGADCPNCHYCKWQRKPKEEANDSTPVTAPAGEHLEAMLANIPPPPGLTPMEPTSEMQTQQSKDLLSSLGSLGHPYSSDTQRSVTILQGCGLACKYVGKAKGCKDGTLCPNCHLCRWSRYANLKVFHL